MKEILKKEEKYWKTKIKRESSEKETRGLINENKGKKGAKNGRQWTNKECSCKKKQNQYSERKKQNWKERFVRTIGNLTIKTYNRKRNGEKPKKKALLRKTKIN